MAPSTRNYVHRTGSPQQTNFYSFAKVSKVQAGKKKDPAKSISIKTLQALSDVVLNRGKEEAAVAAAQPHPVAAAPSSSKLKRKWSDQNEAEEGAPSGGVQRELGSEQVQKSPITKKRTKRSYSASHPASVPEVLQEFRVIYHNFLKGFSLHRAHNSGSSPADLDSLLCTITRLYKKRNVRREDIQRILALFEVPGRKQQQQQQSVLAANGGALLLHNKSPFKLVVSGIGIRGRYLVEYCSDLDYDEARLLESFDQVLQTASSCNENVTTMEQYPLLAYTKGSQTIFRQERASVVRNHILSFGRQSQDQNPASHNVQSTAEPDLSRLSISGPDTAAPPATPPSSTKSRTLSLFDRIKTKQSAALLQPSPSSSQLLYGHALSRIGDVVEILRMKQNQRTVLPATTCNKLTLSMSQAVSLVKGSLTVPMGEEEIRLCFKILAQDVDGDWLKLVEMGGFQSVVVQGRCSMRGEEVKNMLMNKEGLPKAR